MSDENAQLTVPFGLKTIGVTILNIILFIVYVFLLTFLFGLIIGFLIVLNLVSPFVLNNFFIFGMPLSQVMAMVSLLIVVLATIFLRKNIYLRISKKEETPHAALKE
jgi:hypothetical protein